MSKEVCQDLFDEALDGTKFFFDESVDGWVLLEIGDLAEGGGNWKEDAVDLRVLVDEHQSVWNVVVTHVNNGGANP